MTGVEAVLGAPNFRRAACVDADPALFFPPAGGGNQQRVTAAKAWCLSCLDRAACLNYALAEHQYGVWGGTTDKERRDIRRGVRARVCVEPDCAVPVTHPVAGGRIPLRCDAHRRRR